MICGVVIFTYLTIIKDKHNEFGHILKSFPKMFGMDIEND